MSKISTRWTKEVKYIASIYPGVLEPIRLNHGPSPDPAKGGRLTTYQLTPVPKGKPACVIEIADGFENILDVFAVGSGTRNNPVTFKPVDPEETVKVLLGLWTGNMVGVPPGASPGIMEIIGTVPQRSEMEQMRRQQTLYGEFLYADGSRLHREGNWKEITGAMRVMAEWLGRGSDIWVNPAKANEMIDCPECGGIIAPNANVCIHCKTRFRPISAELAQFNPVGAA